MAEAAAARNTANAVAAVSGSVIGYIDRVLERRVTGWVLDRDEPARPIEVEITLDGAPIARGCADRFRKDLAENGIGNGQHSFDIQVDHALPLDQKNRVAACAIIGKSGRRVELVNREVPRSAVSAASARPVGAVPSAGSAIPEGLARWLEDFRSVQVSLENALIGSVKQVREASASHLEAIDRDMKRAGEAVERLHASQQELTRQIETLEVVQVRIDQALAGIRRIEAKEPIRDATERWLKRFVALLAIVSLASLALGIHSLIN